MKKKLTVKNFVQSLIVAIIVSFIFFLFESKKEINWLTMGIMFAVFFFIMFFFRSSYSYFAEEREKILKRKNKTD
ncbi:hypothetical protein [Pedobacter agri]|uniref:hypothetical protein n=1 Tax=Pedobacter agri TaxID=454586 RepID=UPI002931B391|nr:hypothetical protein [Pedobacter agri]